MIGCDNKWQYLISRYRDVVLNHWHSVTQFWVHLARKCCHIEPFWPEVGKRSKRMERRDSTGRINANWARQRNDELASNAAAADVVAEIDRLDSRLLLIRNVKGKCPYHSCGCSGELLVSHLFSCPFVVFDLLCQRQKEQRHMSHMSCHFQNSKHFWYQGG